MISSEMRQTLIQKAEEVVHNAYSPYSQFKVGCSLLTEADQIYTGTNVENVSYGLTICAERNAVFSAIAKEGPHMRLKAVVITSLPRAHLTSPCGACRQVIAEFGKDISIIFPNGALYIDVSLKDLLPHQFVLSI